MNTFYNGKEITKENLLAMIRECMEEGWKNSDLHRETEEALEKIYHGEYEGAEEDIECILEKLNEKNRWGYLYPNANLQYVEIILLQGRGEWFYKEQQG